MLTHAALVGWLVRVNRGRVDVAKRVDVRIAAAPPVVRLPRLPDEPPIGEKQGSGDAIARVDLPDVTRSPDPHDFEQAWTRQRPSIPSPAGEQASLGPAAPTAPVSPPPLRPAPVGSVAAPRPEPPPVKAAAEVDRPPQQAATPARADDPADAGPSDLDAFAKADGVEFKRGGIEARSGRPVKLARPRIDLRFMADATTLRGQSVLVGLRVETDETGAVRDARIVKSSGSAPIDDAVRLAVFDSWFGGKMPDAFPFGVTLWR